jgi:putative SOS response-associated peptidase YedK
MCGRYVRKSDKQRLAEAFHVRTVPDTQADQQLLSEYALDEELVIADWHNHKGRIEKPLGNHA